MHKDINILFKLWFIKYVDMQCKIFISYKIYLPFLMQCGISCEINVSIFSEKNFFLTSKNVWEGHCIFLCISYFCLCCFFFSFPL